jgi:parvulin-like peptidyl-prolyl isomerase
VGQLTREDLDPAFAAAAFELETDALRDVVETPFGFHVIRRTESRQRRERVTTSA